MKPFCYRILPLPLALAAAAVLAHPVQAQDPLTPAEVHQVACAVMQLPPVRAALQAGNGPLLVVSGLEAGHLRRPEAPCPEGAPLPRGATEFRYLRPHAAQDAYGERGQHGAILVDVPPR